MCSPGMSTPADQIIMRADSSYKSALHHVPGTCACRNCAPMGLFVYCAIRNSHMCETTGNRLRVPLLFVYVLHCLCDVQKIIIILQSSCGDCWIVDQTDTGRGHKNLQKTPQRVSKFCSGPEVVSRSNGWRAIVSWELGRPWSTRFFLQGIVLQTNGVCA